MVGMVGEGGDFVQIVWNDFGVEVDVGMIQVVQKIQYFWFEQVDCCVGQFVRWFWDFFVEGLYYVVGVQLDDVVRMGIGCFEQYYG